MQHNLLRPGQALHKAYACLDISRSDIEHFKSCLRTLLDSLNLNETEEHTRNVLRDFLHTTFYINYGISTIGKNDLVIHNGPSNKSPVGVLLEVKNKVEMPSPDKLSTRAMQKQLLYYLREREQHQGLDLRHLIITSVHEWFVFDVYEFERLFYHDAQLRKNITDWSQGNKSESSTDFFCKEIAAPYFDKLNESITFTYLNLQDYEKPLRDTDPKDVAELVDLYKLLSPAHLLNKFSLREDNEEGGSTVCYAHLNGFREGFEL